MKAPTPLNGKKNKAGFSKLNSIQKFLVFIGLMVVAFTALPIVVVLFIGLLPTLTVVITDTKNINKITTIGCLNISGVMICARNLFQQHTSGLPFSISENIPNIIIMLSSAALGVFLFYVLPDLFSVIFKNSAQHRLKVINAKLTKLSENWSNIIPDDSNK